MIANEFQETLLLKFSSVIKKHLSSWWQHTTPEEIASYLTETNDTSETKLEHSVQGWIPTVSNILPERGTSIWVTERESGLAFVKYRHLDSPSDFVHLYSAWMPYQQPEPYNEPAPKKGKNGKRSSAKTNSRISR